MFSLDKEAPKQKAEKVLITGVPGGCESAL